MIRATFTLLLILLSPLFLDAREHTGPKYDSDTYKALDEFAIKFSKQHDLKFLQSSVGRGKRSRWSINLTSSQAMTIEEARGLAAELTYQLLYLVFHKPCFTKHCEIKSKEQPKYYAPQPSEELVNFRLAFWDQNTNRPLFPRVALITFQDNQLSYYYADPKTQALLDPIVESLDSLKLNDYRSK
jgi:hypothetical protein